MKRTLKQNRLVKATVLAVLLVVPILAGPSRPEQRVPASFRYPESQETIQIDRPLNSKELSGVVVDPSGEPASKVLVERVQAGWGKRVGGFLTNSKGRFSFLGMRAGTYFLRISKPGFNTMLLKVRVSRNANSTLRVQLEPSN